MPYQTNQVSYLHATNPAASAETVRDLSRNSDSADSNAPHRSTGATTKFSRPSTPKSRLLPRPWLLEQARREQIRSSRSRSPLSVAILSVAGSSVETLLELYEIAKVLEIKLRETDIFGWYGRNAIAVLMVDTDEAGAEACLSRLLGHPQDTHVAISVNTYPESALAAAAAQAPPNADVPPLFIDDIARFSRTAIILKRALDIAGALAALLLLSPIIALTALAIKLTSPGPILFRQVRLGKRALPFVFFKFRSMRTDAGDDIHRSYVKGFINGDLAGPAPGNAQKPVYKIATDPRITPIGRFIRKSSIDELPQLINVLKGEMSLVGPRPPLPYEVDNYHPWHIRRILEVRPGMTGLWQVEGRSRVSFSDMVRLDLQYSRHWSLALDLKILLKTVKVVLQCRGAI